MTTTTAADIRATAELLAELIAMPTQQAGGLGGAGNERALCDHVAIRLRALGADEVTVADAPRTDGSPGAFVFARWGTPRRVINAHVDTVPANAGWSRDPWLPLIDGERVWGLGACDTKAAIAATLIALVGTAPRDLGVLFSGDEESGSAVLHAFLASPHAASIREVIVCEPTARTAGLSHRGVLACRASLAGTGGHSSKADFMPKPIAQLARLAVALDDLGRRRLHDGPAGMTGLCMNVAALHGGIAFNVVPAHAELEWCIRPYPGFDRAGWDAEVAALAAAIDGGIAITAPIDHEPFASLRPDAMTALVAPFVREIAPLQFWTEAAMYTAAGIDAVVIGPGDIGRAHAADEYVPLDDLGWAVELFRSIIAAPPPAV